MEKNLKGHVLVFPFPYIGHVNPMLQFSKRLQNKGVKITIATLLDFQKNILKDSISFPVEIISDGFDTEGAEPPKSIKEYLTKFEQFGSLSLGKNLEKLEKSGNKVDCIIYDAFIPWAVDVGKKHGVVGAAFFTQSCAVGSIYYHFYKGIIKEKKDEEEEDIIINIPGLPPLGYSDIPSFVTKTQDYPDIAQLSYNQFRNIHMANWVFFNSFYDLEQEVIDWMSKLWNVRPIGPTIPSMYLDKRILDNKDYGLNLFEPATDECISWLKQRTSKSVIYVSFGSVASIDNEAIEEIALGIKSTEKYFLWVVKSDDREKLPINFIEGTYEKGLIVTWCPQLEVLANESIGCFVTHGGWNSTLEAMVLGVPMVVMPQWTDQNTNAKYVMDVFKMGVKAKTDEKGVVRKDVIKDCIMEVMDGDRSEDMKRNSLKWKELARAAMDEGGSSDKNIEEFVSTLVHPYNNEGICNTNGREKKIIGSDSELSNITHNNGESGKRV